MNVISNIMVAVGATLILIGLVGLTVSGVLEEGDATPFDPANGATSLGEIGSKEIPNDQ